MDGFIVFSPGTQVSLRQPEVFEGSYHFWELIEIHPFADSLFLLLRLCFFPFFRQSSKKGARSPVDSTSPGDKGKHVETCKIAKIIPFFNRRDRLDGLPSRGNRMKKRKWNQGVAGGKMNSNFNLFGGMPLNFLVNRRRGMGGRKNKFIGIFF